MLGLASKAGRLVSGEDVVRKSIRQNKVNLIIISEDASENTKKRFLNAAEFYKLPIVIWGQKELIGSSIGKSDRSVIGICDEGFQKSISSLLSDITSNPIEYIGKKTGGEPNE